MSILSRITSIFARGRTAPIDPRLGQSFFIRPSWLPDNFHVDPHTAFQCRGVFQCLSLISQDIAAAPWLVYEVKSDGKRERLGPNDQLTYLLNDVPNPDSIAQTVREAIAIQALVHGNGYAELAFDGVGRVAEIWPLDSQRMAPPTRDAAGNLVYIYTNPGDGQQIVLPQSRVFHLRGLSPDGVMGQAPLTAAARAVASSMAADRMSAAYFANGMTPSGIVTLPAAAKQSDVDALRTSLASEYSAHLKAGKPIVFRHGTTFESISSEPDKSQLLETRQHALEEVAGFFNVPPFMLGVTNAAQGYGSNLSVVNTKYINQCLTPWARRLQQEANKKLVPARSNRVTVLDFSHLSRGTAFEAAQTDEVQIRSGVITVNEARENNDYNAGPAFLDKHALQSTYASAESILDPADPAAAPAVPAEKPTDSAVSALLTLALDNHSRRYRARSKDVAPEKLATAVQDLRSKLATELGSFVPADLASLAEAVEAGAEPRQVAGHHFEVA